MFLVCCYLCVKYLFIYIRVCVLEGVWNLVFVVLLESLVIGMCFFYCKYLLGFLFEFFVMGMYYFLKEKSKRYRVILVFAVVY